MARINVEQKALGDARFARLGKLLGAPADLAQAYGLGSILPVWNACIESGKYVLEGWLVDEILGRENAGELLVSSSLATRYKGGRFRIKGTKGRVEYLQRMRRNARNNGKLGGRPPKPTSVSSGFSEKSPPAPAPAPALLPKNTPCSPPPGDGQGKARAKPNGVVRSIFAFWQEQTRHPKAILSRDRERAIRARLREGYSPEQILWAIAGLARSDFHRGENDRQTVYDDLTYAVRSGKNLEQLARSIPRGEHDEVKRAVHDHLARTGRRRGKNTHEPEGPRLAGIDDRPNPAGPDPPTDPD